MPIVTFPRLLFSLVSLLILAAAVYLLWSWWDGDYVRLADGTLDRVRGERWRLYLGAALLAWSFLGRFVVLMFIPAGADEPRAERGEGRTILAPDRSRLHVETSGRAAGPSVILTHGWGLNATAWWYTRRALGSRFRIVAWDLPGLGRSQKPAGGKFSIDGFAEALGAVVASASPGPVLLVGHSIGGMTAQTLWRACPEAVKARVAGLVLVDTTYENPVRTMWLSPLWRALQRPLIEPLCWLTVALSPLVWLAGWQSYLSGSSQLAMRLTGFGRYATRGQVDLTARLACKGSPAVQAKGNLAMLHWRVVETLPFIDVPVLVLAGDRDIVTLPEASETIARALPRARLRLFEGAGHMGFMERSQLYDEAIAAFAAEVLEGAVDAPGPRPE